MIIRESSFRPPEDKIDSLTMTRLQEIYAMSDSEDEIVEPVTASVYETPVSKKGSNAKANLASPRAIKFSLEV